MKTVKIKSVKVFAVVVAMTAAIIGCGSQNPISTTAAPTGQITPTVTPHEISRSDGGKTFIREDGWPIPSFNRAEREEFETSITSDDGRSLKVYRTVVKVGPLLLFASNPLHLIGMRTKDILIHKVEEYRT